MPTANNAALDPDVLRNKSPGRADEVGVDAPKKMRGPELPNWKHTSGLDAAPVVCAVTIAQDVMFEADTVPVTVRLDENASPWDDVTVPARVTAPPDEPMVSVPVVLLDPARICMFGLASTFAPPTDTMTVPPVDALAT